MSAPARAQRPPTHKVVPSEWKIELPKQGSVDDRLFGGCRSIEVGYEKKGMVGEGTYGEVRAHCLLPASADQLAGAVSLACRRGSSWARRLLPKPSLAHSPVHGPLHPRHTLQPPPPCPAYNPPKLTSKPLFLPPP